MRAEDVTKTLDMALAASGREHASPARRQLHERHSRRAGRLNSTIFTVHRSFSLSIPVY